MKTDVTPQQRPQSHDRFILIVFILATRYNQTKTRGKNEKNIICYMFDIYCCAICRCKELGKNDAKNQNVVVKYTTDTGKISNQTCSLRRYAKCTGTAQNKRCNGWQPWRDLQSPSKQYSDWRSAASACCRAKGLR